MKILVLGYKGQLRRCLYDQLSKTDYEVVYTSREQIDISDFEATKCKLLDIAPEVVINATAYTAVDKAEEDQETADLINHLAVKNIADICIQQGCWLVHISTDYVFYGNSNVPYKEDDITNPQCVYGQTKLMGELAIQTSACKYIILRTSWVFSEYGNNFLKTMLRLAKVHDELNVVGDQYGCPTYAQDIAKAIVQILPQLNSQNNYGLFNYCGEYSCSWYKFAEVIFDEAQAYDFKAPKIINSIKASSYFTPAVRPKFSVLDTSKSSEFFKVLPSDYRLGIKKSLSKLLSIESLQ